MLLSNNEIAVLLRRKKMQYLIFFFGERFLIKCRIGTSLLSQSIFIYRNS